MVVALGGGSTMDASKAMAAAVFYEGDPWDMIFHGQDKPRPPTRALPIIEADPGGDRVGDEQRRGHHHATPGTRCVSPTQRGPPPRPPTHARGGDRRGAALGALS